MLRKTAPLTCLPLKFCCSGQIKYEVMEIYVISKRRTADDSDLSKRSKTNINQEDKKNHTNSIHQSTIKRSIISSFQVRQIRLKCL